MAICTCTLASIPKLTTRPAWPSGAITLGVTHAHTPPPGDQPANWRVCQWLQGCRAKAPAGSFLFFPLNQLANACACVRLSVHDDHHLSDPVSLPFPLLAPRRGRLLRARHVVYSGGVGSCVARTRAPRVVCLFAFFFFPSFLSYSFVVM
jgi:hypothetical protein